MDFTSIKRLFEDLELEYHTFGRVNEIFKKTTTIFTKPIFYYKLKTNNK